MYRAAFYAKRHEKYTFAASIIDRGKREREGEGMQRAIYNFPFGFTMATERGAVQDAALERCICLRFLKRVWE